MILDYGFINGSKCSILVSDADNEERYAVLGQGACGKSLYPALNVAVNLKLL